MANLARSFFQTVAASIPFAERKRAFSALEIPGLCSLFPNGLERGSLAEVQGPRSSGRTALSLRILAAATRRGEICAVVDLFGSFAPGTAADAGIALQQVVWVRCAGNAPHAFRVTDLLLHAGGFGVVLLDLCEATPRMWNGIPLSYWYRFRAAIERTPTILLVNSGAGQVRSAARTIVLQRRRFHWSGSYPARLLTGIESSACAKTPAGISPPASVRSQWSL